MHSKRFTKGCILFFMLVTVMVSACQKDGSDKAFEQKQASAKADSAIAASSPANYLALTGTLTLKVLDSTYTFNAATDSVAFVNISSGDNEYFGITAINKAHTMSFALSSKGVAGPNVSHTVEGSQLILRPDAMHNQQYSLTRFTEQGDAGNIKLLQYRQDSVLAKGAFVTFLAKDDNEGAPFYRVEGSFDLKIKK